LTVFRLPEFIIKVVTRLIVFVVELWAKKKLIPNFGEGGMSNTGKVWKIVPKPIG
jgi:hypothetical protein